VRYLDSVRLLKAVRRRRSFSLLRRGMWLAFCEKAFVPDGNERGCIFLTVKQRLTVQFDGDDRPT